MMLELVAHVSEKVQITGFIPKVATFGKAFVDIKVYIKNMADGRGAVLRKVRFGRWNWHQGGFLALGK